MTDYVCEHGSVIHSSLAFTFSFVSEFPFFSLILLFSSLTTGSLGIRLFFGNWNHPKPDQMFTRRHPKYMEAYSALRQLTGRTALGLQIVIWYVSVVV